MLRLILVTGLVTWGQVIVDQMGHAAPEVANGLQKRNFSLEGSSRISWRESWTTVQKDVL